MDITHLHNDERLEALRLLMRLLRVHATISEPNDDEDDDELHRSSSIITARFPRLALKSIHAIATQRFAAASLGVTTDATATAAFSTSSLDT